MSRFLVGLSLFVLFASVSAKADELTVYVYPSPMGIDWRSPSGLAWSTIENELFDDDDQLKSIHSIGHLNFDLNCGVSDVSPNPVRIFTGQTNTDDEEMNRNLLDNGYGIGVMLTNYTGRWETQSEIEHDLPIRYGRGTVEFIHFKISPGTCARVANYLTEYKQKGLDRIYAGLNGVPRKLQGGGCSAFAESVLEIAGLMPPEWKSYWAHSINIQNSVIGGPITGNHVSVLDILFAGPTHWAPSAKDAYPLTFWDPNYIWWWIKYANQGTVGLSGMTYTKTARNKALGVNIDATDVPTPSDTFWMP